MRKAKGQHSSTHSEGAEVAWEWAEPHGEGERVEGREEPVEPTDLYLRSCPTLPVSIPRPRNSM
eukprot:16436872-Heterocapsa_arctica.AAC.1